MTTARVWSVSGLGSRRAGRGGPGGPGVEGGGTERRQAAGTDQLGAGGRRGAEWRRADAIVVGGVASALSYIFRGVRLAGVSCRRRRPPPTTTPLG